MNKSLSDMQPSQTLAVQRAAFLRDGTPSLSQRRDDLKKLKSAVLAKRHEMESAINADFSNRSATESAILELMPLINGIDYLYVKLPNMMKPEKRHVSINFKPGSARVEYQPLGVIGIMSPWNFPFSLALMPLATAIAAGNRAMIKPSEMTPASSELMRQILQEVFPLDQVAVVTGDASVGAAFSSLPFDHIVFTGSTAVGRAVMRAASENLVPVTLELGGKSPVIIDKNHPLEQAARNIAYGKLSNAGQICISPDYILIHEDEVEPFVAAFNSAVSSMFPEGPSDPAYTAIINDKHYSRIHSLVEDARNKGAKIVETGINPNEAKNRSNTIAPTIVLNVTEEMAIMQEEIFGPVLPVMTYRNIDEAIAYVNTHPRPLALYYFGKDGESKLKVLKRTTSGNVTINSTILHFAQEDLPFGGVGSSGMGAYHGIEGFKALSHAKGIYEQGMRNMSEMLRPPYGRVAQMILKTLL